MDFISLLPAIFSIIGVAIAFYAMSSSANNLKSRLNIEKKLAKNLAVSLKKRNIDSKISIELNQLTISRSCEKECEKESLKQFKAHIEDALNEALMELIASEQMLVKHSLEQPSIQGQHHYLTKLVSSSLNQLNHQQA